MHVRPSLNHSTPSPGGHVPGTQASETQVSKGPSLPPSRATHTSPEAAQAPGPPQVPITGPGPSFEQDDLHSLRGAPAMVTFVAAQVDDGVAEAVFVRLSFSQTQQIQFGDVDSGLKPPHTRHQAPAVGSHCLPGVRWQQHV